MASNPTTSGTAMTASTGQNSPSLSSSHRQLATNPNILQGEL